MTIYLFAGPNGSGKSMIIDQFIHFNEFQNVEYICPDHYAAESFPDIEDAKERYVRAMDFAEYKREKNLVTGKPMIVETVLSRSDKIDFIKKASKHGYRIISVFVGTSSADINCARVKQRVAEGGHDVPEDKIRSRYARSMENLPLLAECSDELYVYDNSGEGPFLAFSMIDGDTYTAAKAPEWVRRALQEL